MTPEQAYEMFNFWDQSVKDAMRIVERGHREMKKCVEFILKNEVENPPVQLTIIEGGKHE